MKKILVLASLLLMYFGAFAQPGQDVEMADALRASGKIYVVIAIIVVIFVGLAIFLFSIDRRLKKLEKEK
ncbi:CcmD family protein [Mucilaginibacter sp. BJC16-A38]|uniref:CcmD family protein n=1 Tax=Mucilaginibacter phenanthrenivorans TaxID=1234842 RepID=UPI0021588BB4|nr:CcmD family protein [Mucilaginibacter phenanthrenivorans]MCR8557094.1 CcmD family protein [Mucilaginibacter phenanthrenivorans]MDP9080114.1 CcmD family protein [Bacteroidota bacterium]